jgi:hypothetical protein
VVRSRFIFVLTTFLQTLLSLSLGVKFLLAIMVFTTIATTRWSFVTSLRRMFISSGMAAL